MRDTECVAFLQWALPRLGLRWKGYRKVRRQVCKRVDRRIRALGLDGIEAYRRRLEQREDEWGVLDDMTRITISRFFRDRGVFRYLDEIVLPALHASAAPDPVRIWSAGCAGGEEAYTLAIAAKRRGILVRITATDADVGQLRRAREATYAAGSLKELPASWTDFAFDRRGEELVLREELRGDVELLHQDIRVEMPEGPFHLVLCRYLAFTYFDAPLQRTIAERLVARLLPDAFVVLGKHESWPPTAPTLTEVHPSIWGHAPPPQSI